MLSLFPKLTKRDVKYASLWDDSYQTWRASHTFPSVSQGRPLDSMMDLMSELYPWLVYGVGFCETGWPVTKCWFKVTTSPWTHGQLPSIIPNYHELPRRFAWVPSLSNSCLWELSLVNPFSSKAPSHGFIVDPNITRGLRCCLPRNFKSAGVAVLVADIFAFCASNSCDSSAVAVPVLAWVFKNIQEFSKPADLQVTTSVVCNMPSRSSHYCSLP